MPKDYFKTMRKTATGLAGLSLTTTVGSAIAAKAPAGTPSLTGGFSTLASFTPIAVTAVSGKAVLDVTKKLKKKKYYG